MSEQIGAMPALYAALAKAQGAFSGIAKNRKVRIQTKVGGSFEFRYADIDAVLSAVRRPLADNGLALVQVIQRDGESTVLVTSIVHSGGGTISSEIALPRGGDDPKAFGAIVTYFRRYAICAILCVAADDDLDESPDLSERTSRSPAPVPQARRPSEEQPPGSPSPGTDPGPPPGSSSESPPAPATQGQKAYLRKRAESLGTQVSELCHEFGVSDFEMLNIDQFEQMKNALLERA